MDKDRIEGSVKQVKGSVEEAAGKLLGDAKMTADGTADQIGGRFKTQPAA